MTFEEYLTDNNSINQRYELVEGKLVKMPPISFLRSDIIDFIADCFKAIADRYKLELKIKTGDVGIRTGINSARIPDICVVDRQVWQNYRRDRSAVLEGSIMLAAEVVSPRVEHKFRGYKKLNEYQDIGIPEYWIVDPIEQKVTVSILRDGIYRQTIFMGDEAIASAVFAQLDISTERIINA